jgi:prepilin-type N-terminal cleavage/methylation domain-containing protein
MLFKIISKSNRGFTLIEMLVSVAIMGILAAIVAPNFYSALSGKRIDDVLGKIEGAIKEAQSTSIKKSRVCTVQILSDKVTATNMACLPSGERSFQLGSNSNISIKGTGGTSGTNIIISPFGNTPSTQTTEAIVVFQNNGTNSKLKCLVVSSGIGIIRTGNFTAAMSTVPDLSPLRAEPIFANPSSPTLAETTDHDSWVTERDARIASVDGVVNNCITP